MAPVVTTAQQKANRIAWHHFGDGYTGPAIEVQGQASSQKALLFCRIAETVQTLETEEAVGRFFKERAERAISELLGGERSRGL
jgi:hypothetical protein